MANNYRTCHLTPNSLKIQNRISRDIFIWIVWRKHKGRTKFLDDVSIVSLLAPSSSGKIFESK